MTKNNPLVLALISILSVCFASPMLFADSVIVSIQPPVSSVQVGSFFNVNVDIVNVPDLFAFQFDLSFDPAVLSAVTVTEGPFLPGVDATIFIPGIVDNSLGTISFTAGSLVSAISGATGSGTLATVAFRALALGASPINLSNVILLDSTLTDISFATADGTANVVPEPASLLLVGTGIGALGLIVRRRRT